MLKTTLAGIGLTALVVVTAVAIQAHDGNFFARDVPNSDVVSHVGLDLTQLSGIAALEGRLALSIRRVCGGDQQCRQSAYTGTRPQVAAAFQRDAAERAPGGLISIEPQLLALSPEERRWTAGPLSRAFDDGGRVAWAQWPAHGQVSVSAPVYVEDVACRNVIITRSRRGEDEILAEGTRCGVPGLLPRYHRLAPRI